MQTETARPDLRTAAVGPGFPPSPAERPRGDRAQGQQRSGRVKNPAAPVFPARSPINTAASLKLHLTVRSYTSPSVSQRLFAAKSSQPELNPVNS